MKILLIGDRRRTDALRTQLITVPDLEIDYSDGDEDEDFKEYDVLFDLNFDDDPSALSLYAGLREKPVFVNAVKMSLAEAVYLTGAKLRCKLFGMNGIAEFIENDKWELSVFRKFETPDLELLMKKFNRNFELVDDRIGMVKPRVIFMIINEACYTLQEGTASIEDIDLAMKLGTGYPYGPFEWCDRIGISPVFETLAALFEDTKDERYKICPLLKTKYLKNETFYRQAKSTVE